VDKEAYETFLLLDRKWAAATVQANWRRMALLAEEGFDWGAFTVDKARAHLAMYVRTNRGPHAYNLALRTIKAYADFLDVDARRLKAQPVPRSQYKFLSPLQIQSVLSYRHDKPAVERFRRAFSLWQLKSAMRIGEAAGMQVRDLDQATSPRRFYVRRPSKRGMQRWLPLESWVLSPKRAMGAYLAHHPQTDPTQPLWLCMWDERGRPADPEPFTKDGLARTLDHMTEELGFRLNSTITRHTRATELRRMGWDLLGIQYYLGHSSVKSTQVYAGMTPDDLQRLMRNRGSRDPFQTES